MKNIKKIYTVALIMLIANISFAQDDIKIDSLVFQVLNTGLTTQFTGTYNATKDKFKKLKIDIYSVENGSVEIVKQISGSKKYNIGGTAPVNILVDLPVGNYVAYHNEELEIESVNFVNENEVVGKGTLYSESYNESRVEVIDPAAEVIQKQLIQDEFIGERQTFNLKFTIDDIYLNNQELPKKYHKKYLNIIADYNRKPTAEEPVDIWVIYSK